MGVFLDLFFPKMASKIDWFLKHQEEARAYRVTKVRMPRFGYTALKDSIQSSIPGSRHVHFCSEKLFPQNCEELRVRDPWIGLDFYLIHDEFTFEKLFKSIVCLHKTIRKDLKITVDLTFMIDRYGKEDLEAGLEGIFRLAEFLGGIKIAFATVQLDPYNIDIHDRLIFRNIIVLGKNYKHFAYTPYLHRSTMRAKKGALRLRANLWSLSDDSKGFHLNNEGCILYMRFMKSYHEKGFAMSTDGICNPVTFVKNPDKILVDGFLCGTTCKRVRGAMLDLVVFKQLLAGEQEKNEKEKGEQ